LEEDAPQILQTFNDTLNSCLSYPSNSVADFGFLDSSLLSTTNETFEISSEPSMLLHSAFERNVRERPLATALDFLYPDGKRAIWAFEELNRASNQIAHVLFENGVRREEAVLICMHKSPLFYAAILGVLKAGATFTPMDPESSSGHKSSVMRELQARVILSNSTVDTSWCAVKPITLDIEGLLCTKSKYHPPTEKLSHSTLAYRMYTSGTIVNRLQGLLL
jgi:ferricrocin synthase